MSDSIWVGTRKGLLHFAYGRDMGWELKQTCFAGEPVSAVLVDERENTLYAALNLGHFGPKLHRSGDGGLTWQEMPAPAFPKQEKGEKAPSVDQVWTLALGWNAGELWAGTIPCGLFRSCDRAQSWEFINSLTDMENSSRWFGGGYDHPGVHSILVQEGRLLVAISCGGVWESTDQCSTWQSRTEGMRAAYMPPDQAYDPDIQDPHRMLMSPANPDELWVQHHNGIFHSSDGGRHWHEIDTAGPSVFGFALAVHPSEPGTAWFVPAVKDECRMPVDNRLVVTRTRDGGRSFDILSEGLPAADSFDLVYRHALAIDKSGEKLAMGSTSGNLWITTNQGENWLELSHTLAMIYCVSFG